MKRAPLDTVAPCCWICGLLATRAQTRLAKDGRKITAYTCAEDDHLFWPASFIEPERLLETSGAR